MSRLIKKNLLNWNNNTAVHLNLQIVDDLEACIGALYQVHILPKVKLPSMPSPDAVYGSLGHHLKINCFEGFTILS